MLRAFVPVDAEQIDGLTDALKRYSQAIWN
ncbi:UNVERIFIED_ORG: hypothetical protein GGR68_002858 [Xanthomonas campestris]